MVDRQGLLDTGKEIAQSAAGTFKSAAGTLAETGKDALSRTGERVQESVQELTDDDLTTQERARLERAREEAQREARREAQEEFEEEFRENIVDEAFDRELQRLQRETGVDVSDRQQTEPEPRVTATEVTQSIATGGRQQRAPPPQPEPRPASPSLGLFGVPTSPQGRATEERQETASPQFQMTEQLFGINPEGEETRQNVDPLFGFQF